MNLYQSTQSYFFKSTLTLIEEATTYKHRGTIILSSKVVWYAQRKFNFLCFINSPEKLLFKKVNKTLFYYGHEHYESWKTTDTSENHHWLMKEPCTNCISLPWLFFISVWTRKKQVQRFHNHQPTKPKRLWIHISVTSASSPPPYSFQVWTNTWHLLFKPTWTSA